MINQLCVNINSLFFKWKMPIFQKKIRIVVFYIFSNLINIWVVLMFVYSFCDDSTIHVAFGKFYCSFVREWVWKRQIKSKSYYEDSFNHMNSSVNTLGYFQASQTTRWVLF